MTVEFTNRFIKDFNKLSPKLKKKANRALDELPNYILEKRHAGMQVKKRTKEELVSRSKALSIFSIFGGVLC